MNKCNYFEVTLINKYAYIVSMHRSPSQSHNDVEDVLFNLDQLSDIFTRNPQFMRMTGNFNAKSAK